jgi:ABC-type sugar transport system ATPase subunit
MSKVICKIANITKVFPGVKALDDISFNIEQGEIHAVIGENGAGKSTLMNILSGVYFPDGGYVEFNGKKNDFKNTRDAQHVGIGMIHQELSLAIHMSVADNIFQGRMLKNKFGFIDKKKMVNDSRDLLNELGVDYIDPRKLVKYLSVAQMQMVEISKAISLKSKMLIMDEPTSSLTTTEITLLLEIMRSLKEQGVSILFITHKLEEIKEVADRVTILRDGKYVDTLPIADTSLEKMVSLMVGRDFDQKAHREFIKDYTDREVVLEVKDFNVTNRVRNASFKLYKGEVLGLTGLVGAGRSELLQGIFGMDKVISGEVYIDGEKVKIKHPEEAIKRGIGMVPEGRKEQGMFLRLSVQDNMTIVRLKQLATKLGFIRKGNVDEIVTEYIDKLSIKTPSAAQVAENLSGGNQQKTIIARWLMNSPEIVFMDEPTHGIDIGAKGEIYKIIDSLSKQGVSVILLTSELPEALGLCDRIMVMHHGEIRGILSHEEADQVKIMSFTLESSKEEAV